MNISAPFILRPVAATLLTLGITLAGLCGFFLLPVAPLPQYDVPTISVSASLPGANPETVATSVATPLERHLGQIADVTEMTSSSSLGSGSITLQFGFDRDIDGAARDVQAAINDARADLPTSLKSNPTYRKVNPADAPILILSLTSRTLSRGQIYDAAATVLQQKISQLPGIGQVTVSGASLPAVRVELNPHAVFKYGLSLEQIRTAISQTNANTPKGAIENGDLRYQIYTNDQAKTSDQYRNLVITYVKGAPVRLSDLGTVLDSVEDVRNDGMSGGLPAVAVILFKQPDANVIDTVDHVKALIPWLQASIPQSITISLAMDRSTTIRSSVFEVERTLVISIALVILVVFLFLRQIRATLIPGVAVTVSLIGTFGVMYLLGYTLDNLSLMALIVATGFVVDDAIVVMENIARHIEDGMAPLKAALQGTREVSFTVLSMSLSLVAVFIPILMMGGLIGRLFREFAVTLSAAILVSLFVSLTATPMMCAYIMKKEEKENPDGFLSALGDAFDGIRDAYMMTLRATLRAAPLVALVLVLTIIGNVLLISRVHKGIFPQQDTGRIQGSIQADQSISFQAMDKKFKQFMAIVQEDPAVDTAIGSTGGGRGTNTGNVFVSLKPLSERKVNSEVVMARLKKKLAVVPGAVLYMQAPQDVRVGGRQGNAQYQFTLQADSLEDLRLWEPKLEAELKKSPEMTDVSSDQQDKGLETEVTIDRETAARLFVTASQIDNTLYDAFGQRQVSVIYNPLNQYHVVMEVSPEYWQNPESLKELYVGGPATLGAVTTPTAGAPGASTVITAGAAGTVAAAGQSPGTIVSGGPASATGAVPLQAVTRYGAGTTPLSINHHGHFPAITISFNLPEGESLSDAVTAVDKASANIHMPATIHGTFEGTARTYQESMATEPYLVLAAITAVYLILGILYESLMHPITILSTLPSAGLGAVAALILTHTEFNIIGFIGIILLIGVVKKNAIMMIDFAIDAERNGGLSAVEAITKACELRFRPIMMTTMAALLGALPLALGFGDGAELRKPLGISIVGGLLVSQVLTLYTTPVVYIYLDRLRIWLGGASPEHMREAQATGV